MDTGKAGIVWLVSKANFQYVNYRANPESDLRLISMFTMLYLTVRPKVSLYSVILEDTRATRQVRAQRGQISQVNEKFSIKEHWQQRDEMAIVLFISLL